VNSAIRIGHLISLLNNYLPVTMPVMPPPAFPTPTRRRLTCKRVLLAVVLGLVAWWGVGWWLSPRPILELHYPDTGKLALPPDDHAMLAFDVRVTAKNRLILIRPNAPTLNRITFDQFNVLNGENLGTEVCNASEFLAHPLTRADGFSGPGFSAHTPAGWTETIWFSAKPEFHIAGTQQYVTNVTTFSLGERMDEWIDRMPWVASLIGRGGFAVTDNAGKVLWRVPIDYQGGARMSGFKAPSGSHLVLIHSQRGTHSIYTFAVPLVASSHWWSRAAGLLVAALVLLVRRRHSITLPAA
jgi:hypothetical protein